MSLIQDKLGSEFLRPNGSMDGGFGTSMLMFSHLPPVTSFTRLAAQSVMADMPPQEMMSLKKERDSPDCGGGMGIGGLGGLGGLMGGVGDYVHAMGIKQEKLPEHDYRLPLYPGGGGGGGHNGVMGQRNGSDLLEVSLGNHQNLMVHDLSLSNQLSGRLGKESSGRKGRKSNGDGTEGKPRRKRGESKALMLDPDGESLSPHSKPHICEHCNAAFRSSYHLRRHVLIHTGERPFRCSQCNMSFIQKYLLQRHEKIHSGEKPFSCDQCNMRFIQKYHMERHKRTHSGEKPYKCDTCQQYFSRTDRLLKHKRTCGEAIKKGVDGALLEAGLADDGQGSYSLTQGNGPAPGRKRAKAKGGEGGDRKRRKQGAAGPGPAMGAQDGAYGSLHAGSYSLDKHGADAIGHPGPSMHHSEHGRPPKMAFKKGGRSKGLERGAEAKHGGLDGLGLLQTPGEGAKTGTATSSSSSSNYDDAMQFLKKRRYLTAANGISGGVSGVGSGNGVEYDVGVGHLGVQGSGVMDNDGPLVGLLDPSPLVVDLKHDIKSSIPDEVLQSLLEHYTHKPDFDLSDSHHHHPHHHNNHHHHVDLQPPLGHDDDAPSPGGDKTVMMHEYSRFLLQALERTSGHHGVAGFPPPNLGPSPSSSSSSPSVTGSFPGPLYSSDKHVVYSSSPLECGGFGQPAASPATSSPSLSSTSSVPKSHFSLLSGSPPQPSQHAFHLGGLEPVLAQQLTPSQELIEQLDKPHSSSTSSSPPAPHTAPHTPSSSTSSASAAKNGASAAYPLTPSQDLATLDTAKSAYQIENFAQAFGSQFKAVGGGGGGGGRGVPMAYGTDSGGEVDHCGRTPISEFSGYASLLADVGEPVSTGSKTPTSQSYR
ncbi:zinc finger protein 281 isoform X1 [Clupea harengus]|uniref:Zinc finger protein 281 n=1 Tax=Clupea harengus TaxID=7950 RepID=A0A6P3VU50_CLUHA|nr:zinc finger protein 281 isoform X1 [Clupea harengus]XP_031427220.1 zinc finger protein 281 isoform X1 [Clupea harengus]